MDYSDWSQEYLKEAAMLRARETGLLHRAEADQLPATDRLFERTALLHAMYLDCLHTGRELARKAARL